MRLMRSMSSPRGLRAVSACGTGRASLRLRQPDGDVADHVSDRLEGPDVGVLDAHTQRLLDVHRHLDQPERVGVEIAHEARLQRDRLHRDGELLAEVTDDLLEDFSLAHHVISSPDRWVDRVVDRLLMTAAVSWS